LFGSALVSSTLLVYAAKEARLWHTTALKATVYWFVGTAVVLIADAVTRASLPSPASTSPRLDPGSRSLGRRQS
jgi:hypothetical protein